MSVKNKIVISVIIPVYNKEKYLKECIYSICIQSYKNFELILIDDGSTDNSGNICDVFSKKDERIRVFHTKNYGVGSARNLGIDNASGEYIMFVDADDMLNRNCLKMMIDNMETGVDMVLCGFLEMKNYKIVNKVSLSEEGIYKIDTYLDELVRHDIHYYYNGPCAKLIRNNFKTNTLRYEENEVIGEDFVFNIRMLRNVRQVKIIDNCLYTYRIDANDSLSKTKNNTKYFYKRYMKMYSELHRTILLVGHETYYEKYLQRFRNKIVKSVVRNVLFDKSLKEIKDKIQCLEILRRKFKKYGFFEIQQESDIKFRLVILMMKYKMYFTLYIVFHINYFIFSNLNKLTT